ncbi:O-antigen ligase family protein [Micromonospora endophytica]|uniref:O-antigen ligase-related domain-containing protein n=1 Tax=Micromonospora endophytica TaxID=515350 RepID=A0A2W2D4F2_9ACTN|nr:O-antigen ligase family protein [Micromonospora endophytica]PZG00485.1 hypothetical protein C1I93_02440 [Micromonospora endophytica]RIW46404.1 O-antigen ligase family protein [Micromonospora endophytica]BCJ57429.1 hypothetical protein Jiend_08510 [Micromonospora endophytica]
MNRLAQCSIVAGAAGLVVVATLLAVDAPLVAIGLPLLLLLVALVRRMDGWRWLLGLATALLVCAASDLPTLVELSFYPRYAAVAGLVVWALFQPLRAPVRLASWTRILVGALWAIAGLATLSALWSVVPLETFQRGVALVLLAALVHVLLRRRWSERAVVLADLRTIYLVLSVSALVSLGYGLTNGVLPAALPGNQRFQGIYNNPNLLGIVCALAIPLGWAMYQQFRRPVLLLGTLPAGVCLLLSQSRTGIVAVLVGAAWVLLRRGFGPVTRTASAVAVTLLLAHLLNLLPIIFSAPWMQRIVLRFTDPGGTDLSNGRTEMWQATIDLWWQERPTLGFGYASRNHLIELAGYDGAFAAGISLVHNSYLQLLLELGLTAVVPLVALLLAVGRGALRVPVRGANSGLVWLVVSGVIVQLTESAIFGTGQPYPYVFWLAVAALLHQPTADQDGERSAAEGEPRDTTRLDQRVPAAPAVLSH